MVFQINIMYQTNPHDGSQQYVTPVVIKSICEVDKLNFRGVPYRVCTVQVIYPDGTIGIVGAVLYAALMDSAPAEFS